MPVLVYTQCMDGHFYAGLRCPADGSTSDDASELAPYIARARPGLTRESLLEAGAPADAVAHALFVDVARPGRYGPPPAGWSATGYGPMEIYVDFDGPYG